MRIIYIGFSVFIPKLYGEMMLTDTQIALLTALPTVFCAFMMPIMGMMTDRVSQKRYALAICLAVMGVSCMFVEQCKSFGWMMLPIMVFSVFGASVSPIMNTLTIEYTAQIGKSYGPIRFCGTAGYQVGALLVGVIFAKKLKGLYPMMGGLILFSMLFVTMMPKIQGHQHAKAKVPLKKLFEEKKVVLLFGIIFFATVPTQFYSSFFTKHLGEIGMSNQQISIITIISVFPELLFLMFGDRLYKKASIWVWLFVAVVMNGLRWLGLGLCRSFVLILLVQLPTVSVMACFEFFPALYLNDHVQPELKGSAQSILSLTTFCGAKVIGSLLGGVIADHTSISTVFLINSAMELIGAVILFPIIRKMNRKEMAV